MPDGRLAQVRARRWDFALTVATVALLGSLGLQSFAGTLYSWWALRAVSNWQTTGYASYVATMNAIAAPQMIALVAAMGLCVPKRLFSRRALVVVSVVMVAVGLTAGLLLGSLAIGLGLYLVLAAFIQVAVVALTLSGARSVSYLTQGRLTRAGSGLLHLGFVVFAFVVVALQRSRLMFPVFAVAATLVAVGTAVSFYADTLASHATPPASEASSAPMPAGDATGKECPSDAEPTGP